MGQASGVSIAQGPRGGRGDGRGRRRGGSKGRDRIEGGKCMRVEVKKKKRKELIKIEVMKAHVN